MTECELLGVCKDGEEALEFCLENPPDVLLTDLNMPRMDGFGFIEEVRKIPQYQLLPILILTTESDAERKAKARSIGATGWITKPFEPEKLISVVKRVAS